MKADELELGERERLALEDENTGNIHHRKNVIVERWFDGTLTIADEIDRKTKELLNEI